MRDAPHAFGSTFEAEVDWSEDNWRARIADRARFVAESDGQVVGTVAGGPSNERATAALTSLWVDPLARGRGVGEALVNEVLGWAEHSGYRRVVLWVVDGNSNAERLYRRTGFRRTGAVQAVRPGEARIEYEMSRPI